MLPALGMDCFYRVRKSLCWALSLLIASTSPTPLVALQQVKTLDGVRVHSERNAAPEPNKAVVAAHKLVGPPVLPRQTLAQEAFGNDSPWYLENIPFIEIDDAAIQRTYYYRWEVYRSHLRDIGAQGFAVTEFLPPVVWARHPYEDLNDSSSFHILEGRWLRDPNYVTSLVDHLYSGAGNDRHFSESIASATLAWTKVTGDARPALRHLDVMRTIYNLWDDHFDAARNLYWVEPLLDATEFTISSIDASGAGFSDHPDPKDNGFMGGFAYRPSINAYQYGNARAIAELARVAGQRDVAVDFTRRAELLRVATLRQLWNPALTHFTDIYQRSTRTVKAGEFIRGRELVGLVPWQFELPPTQTAADTPDYAGAWRHALASAELGGKYGLRTVEPSYVRYMVQYRYDGNTARRECQWNGPSWPFQTSQALSGLANLLDEYPHEMAARAGVTASSYVHLLRQYTSQHRLPSGVMDIEEDYNPDTGAPIVGLSRSHHYLHSTYNDLVLSGLIGIRPRSDDTFELNPLLPTKDSSEAPIRFFALENLRYHGHEMAIVYDADGSRYHLGAGITIFSDGVRLVANAPLGRVLAPLHSGTSHKQAARPQISTARVNLAVNVWGRAPSAYEPDLPTASASSTAPERETISAVAPQLYQPLDGRQWFFPEIEHGWSPGATNLSEDWYAIDLRSPKRAGSVDLAFFADDVRFAAPVSVRLQAREGGQDWKDIAVQNMPRPLGNGTTVLKFEPRLVRELRVIMLRDKGGLPERLVVVKIFAPATTGE